MTDTIRKIASTVDLYYRDSRGCHMHQATLTCGHTTRVTSTDRKKGQVYCMDCYWDQAKAPQAKGE